MPIEQLMVRLEEDLSAESQLPSAVRSVRAKDQKLALILLVLGRGCAGNGVAAEWRAGDVPAAAGGRAGAPPANDELRRFAVSAELVARGTALHYGPDSSDLPSRLIAGDYLCARGIWLCSKLEHPELTGLLSAAVRDIGESEALSGRGRATREMRLKRVALHVNALDGLGQLVGGPRERWRRLGELIGLTMTGAGAEAGAPGESLTDLLAELGMPGPEADLVCQLVERGSGAEKAERVGSPDE